jgi:tetratricopeptide (TPR) repeat protein
VVQQRVFLSAVSSEFGLTRDALAKDLIAQGHEPVWQPLFPDHGNADSLQSKLRDLVDSCDAVICLLGQRSGSYPPTGVASRFAYLLPAGTEAASRTQWEFLFARSLNKPRRLFRADAGLPPDNPSPTGEDFPDRQAAWLAWMDANDFPWTGFRSIEQLLAEVAKIDWGTDAPSVRKPIVLPYPSLGVLFKGRDDFMARLRESLLRENGGATAIVSKAVHGIGGIGKTRAAVEYAWTHRDAYTALLFVQADTPDNLATNLAALTGPLRLREAADPNQELRLQAALAWLRGNPGWFLILDNVDTEPARDAAVQMLGQLSGGHVVLTSRLDAGAWDFAEPLDLDVLGREYAAAYLREATEGRRLKRPDDAAQARSVAEELGQLALALTLAAATIRERQCSFADYRVLWAEAREKVRGWNQKTITGYHTAVGQTWQTSAAQVSAEARVLLERLAFLAPDPVPGFLLEGEVPGAPPLNAREALLDLARYSLVTREPEADRFTVHRLVQDATRRALDPAAARERLTEALGWVDAAFAGDPQDVRSWGRLDPLAPHAEAVVTHAGASSIAGPAGRLTGALGNLFQTKALYARSEPLMRRALAIDEATFGKNHPDVARDLNDLAYLLAATNRLGEAEPLYRRALDIDEASYGNDHPNIAERLNNLATLLQATNRLGEAEPLMRRALGIDEASYGKDHPTVATALNNLAQLLKATNRLGEAEPLMRRALAIDEASLGKDHPTVATALNNLALLLQATNRLGEAEPLMRRALGIDEASYGNDHPEVAIDLNNLAQLLQATNRLGEAEPLMRRALGIDEASYGNDHPRVAIRLNNLAGLLQDTNRLGEAESLMRRMVVIFLAFERATGHAHPHRDVAIRNYSGLLAAMGKSEAEIATTIAAPRREAGLGQA